MTGKHDIQYFQNKNIDKLKWDECIRNAGKSLIYNYSWWLDAMADNWDGLVLNDYEAVMPLVWRKKYGISYLYQPYFMAQVSISGNIIDTSLTDSFIKAIPPHIKYIDIDLDERNTPQEFDSFCRKRVNMLLNVNMPYEEIQSKYHRLATRMIRKSEELHVELVEGIALDAAIRFYIKQYNANLKIDPGVYRNLTIAFQHAMEKQQLLSLAASKNGSIVAVYMLLTDNQFVYSVIGGSSAEGKESGAFYMLTDTAIKALCNTGKDFRFEGSDIKGIADFNGQFGASPFYYQHLKINKLPTLLRMFKQ